jgi:hypothetical protein
MSPSLHRFQTPENRVFANLRLRGSKIPENRECPAPEKHISRTSLKLDVLRVTDFPKFPNIDHSESQCLALFTLGRKHVPSRKVEAALCVKDVGHGR